MREQWSNLFFSDFFFFRSSSRMHLFPERRQEDEAARGLVHNALKMRFGHGHTIRLQAPISIQKESGTSHGAWDEESHAWWREPRLMVQKECRTSFPQISTGAKNSASCTSLPPSRPSTAPPRTGPSRRNRTASGWSDHLLVFFWVFFVVFFLGGAGA